VEIQQLRCFVTVAEKGSFTKAALALQVTQPSLSQAVARLETEFGVHLFHRVARGVILTSEGEALIQPARQVLLSVDNTTAAVASLHGVTAGALDVVAMSAFTTVAAELMAAFRSSYPEVTLRIHQPGSDDEACAAVTSGECDVGFVRVMEAPEHLSVHELTTEESVVLLPRDSPPGRGSGPIKLTEVSQLPLIVGAAGTVARLQTEGQFAEQQIPIRIAAESQHHETSIELVRGGVGAYLTTRGGLPSDIESSVTVRPLKPARLWPMGLVHRPEALSPAAAAFVTLALAHFECAAAGVGPGAGRAAGKR